MGFVHCIISNSTHNLCGFLLHVTRQIPRKPSLDSLSWDKSVHKRVIIVMLSLNLCISLAILFSRRCCWWGSITIRWVAKVLKQEWVISDKHAMCVLSSNIFWLMWGEILTEAEQEIEIVSVAGWISRLYKSSQAAPVANDPSFIHRLVIWNGYVSLYIATRYAGMTIINWDTI